MDKLTKHIHYINCKCVNKEIDKLCVVVRNRTTSTIKEHIRQREKKLQKELEDLFIAKLEKVLDRKLKELSDE